MKGSRGTSTPRRPAAEAFPCAACGASIEPAGRRTGTRVRCAACGTWAHVPADRAAPAPRRPTLRRLLRRLGERLVRWGGGSGALLTVPLDRIRVRRSPPRRAIGSEGLDALVRSVSRHGILVPLVVRPAEDGFELISGHRRLAAARRAGLREIPAVVRKLGDREADTLRIGENALREPLSAIDLLEASERVLLAGPRGDTRASIAALGLDPGFFEANRDLLALPEPVKEALALGLVDAESARVLGRLGDRASILRGIELAATRGAGARELEAALAGGGAP